MAERVSIFKRYAKQLMDIDLETLGRLSEGLSGRGIKEVCLHAERKFASLKLRGLTSDETPQASLYRSAILARVGDSSGGEVSQI